MVKVCDCIMGSGKSSSAITYLNEHKNEKFIYITPYLEEAKRIRSGCPGMRFVEPSDKLRKYHNRKSEHTAALIKEGKNITTTHQAFKRYTQETLDDIKAMGYNLIIDENVEVLETFELHPNDLEIAVDAGYVKDNDGIYSLSGKEYSGDAFKDMFSLLRSRELLRIDDEKDGTSMFYWALPPELITSFKSVLILTYLFKSQSLHHFLDIYNIPYEFIGIERTETGGYRFGSFPGYVPEYVRDLKKMIHILDNRNINNIGDDRYALSMSWFESNDEGVETLKKNVYNCINNTWSGIPANKKLWATYKGQRNKIKGKGYSNSFLNFNAKATNAYKDRNCLVYVANIFMNVNEKKFYNKHGIAVDEDMYALSVMIQWIWRSAIRDGSEIYLYIPSKRMRTLLIDWIEKTSKGGNSDGTENV